MRGEIVTHFCLLPQTVPALISSSIRGWSVVVAQEEGCCATYRSRARTTAEWPTVHPSRSEASWLSRSSTRLSSWLSVWVRGKSIRFGGVRFARAISEIISH